MLIEIFYSQFPYGALISFSALTMLVGIQEGHPAFVPLISEGFPGQMEK